MEVTEKASQSPPRITPSPPAETEAQPAKPVSPAERSLRDLHGLKVLLSFQDYAPVKSM